ncbi:MAG: helix-turn-helix domain-containing protein [Ketobacter sp.]|nr:helix-turn-helix domain-containing protein [Ketobacter sp.]
MSFQAMTWAISKTTEKSVDKLLLLLLANYANEKMECWPAQETLAKDMCCSVRTVHDAMKRLEASKLIHRTPRHVSGSGRKSDIIKLTEPADIAGSKKGTGSKKREPADIADRTGNIRQTEPAISAEEPIIEPIIEPIYIYTDSYINLWGTYPRASNSNKKLCAQKFSALTAEQQAEVLESIPNYNAYCQDNPWYTPKKLETYLSEANWTTFLPDDLNIEQGPKMTFAEWKEQNKDYESVS